MTLYIVMFRSKNIDRQLIHLCSDVLGRVFDESSVKIVDEVIEIPMYLYDSRRNQYLADGVVYLISGLLKSNEYGILLADIDAYVPGLNFVFGLAIPTIRSAAVFTHRLKLWTEYSGFVERVQKEVLHELGHLLGLNHCSNTMCVMRFSNTVIEVDTKGFLFCIKCSSKLVNRGVRLRVYKD